MKIKEYISLVKQFFSDTPADLNTPEAEYFRKRIIRFPDEAVYIYSFKENKLLYVDGFYEMLGYKDDEISFIDIVSTTTKEYMDIKIGLHKNLQPLFLGTYKASTTQGGSAALKKICKDGSVVNTVSGFYVTRVENNKMVEIMGRIQLIREPILEHFSIQNFGFEVEKVTKDINYDVVNPYSLTEKEKEALKLVCKGYTFKEIALQLNVSSSAIEKRILPLYRKFNVHSLNHLVGFCYENHLLP